MCVSLVLTRQCVIHTAVKKPDVHISKCQSDSQSVKNGGVRMKAALKPEVIKQT